MPADFLARFKLENEDIDNIESYELLKMIGKKRGMLVSGGEIDTERAAIMLLDEFRSAKLGRITVEMPQGREQWIGLNMRIKIMQEVF